MSSLNGCVTSKPGECWMPASPSGRYLMGLSCRKRAEIPVYSFEKHARLDQTTSIYSPHVLVLEGIFALYDPRVLELMDMKVKPCLWLSAAARRRLT